MPSGKLRIPQEVQRTTGSVVKAVARFFNPTPEEVVEEANGAFRDNKIVHIHVTGTECPSLPVYTRPSLVAAVAAAETVAQPVPPAVPAKQQEKRMRSTQQKQSTSQPEQDNPRSRKASTGTKKRRKATS